MPTVTEWDWRIGLYFSHQLKNGKGELHDRPFDSASVFKYGPSAGRNGRSEALKDRLQPCCEDKCPWHVLWLWLKICRTINVIPSSCLAAIHCFPSVLVTTVQAANIFWLSASINYRAPHMIRIFSISNVGNFPVEKKSVIMAEI